MLHFLAGLALCIFIGERVWHYGSIIRLRRAERREERRIETLYNPKPPIKPMSVWLAAGLGMAVVIVGVALGSALAPAPSAVVAATAHPDSGVPTFEEINRLLPPAPKPPHG